MSRSSIDLLILIVDDDPTILGSLAEELEAEGYRTITAANGDEGEDQFRNHSPDLILTDLAMPLVDGFEFIARVRRVSRTPIIVLSVHGSDSDKIRGLDLGADDYVVKPFSVPEMMARIRAQLRRSAAGPSEKLEFPDLSIDFERRRVVQGGREIKLTPTEFNLLEVFASNAGKPVTMDGIIARVWKGTTATNPDTVRVHVASLRKKIEPDPSNPRYIITEPWIGYRFLEEPLESESEDES